MQIKPREIKTIRYWLHLAVLAAVVLGILQLWKGGNMFSLTNVLYSIPLLGAGDIVAHTLLGID